MVVTLACPIFVEQKQKIMFTYKLRFSTGKKAKATTKNLDACQALAIKYLVNEGDSVEIISETGKTHKIVKRTAEYHWNHNGFLFL